MARERKFFRTAFQVAILCGTGVVGVSSAQQEADPTVDWVASWAEKEAVARGGIATLELAAEIQEGWHVYALSQAPGGPVALRVSLEDNGVARLAGTPSGTPPEEQHDPRFNLDTSFYTHSFIVRVPVSVNKHVGAGKQLIPVGVRFQTCSDRECQPPKTIHLSVPLDVAPET